jgi:hypothetical protein
VCTFSDRRRFFAISLEFQSEVCVFIEIQPLEPLIVLVLERSFLTLSFKLAPLLCFTPSEPLDAPSLEKDEELSVLCD